MMYKLGFVALIVILLLGVLPVSAAAQPSFSGCLSGTQVKVSVVNQGTAGRIGYVLYVGQNINQPVTGKVYDLGQFAIGQVKTFILPADQRYAVLMGVAKVADVWRYVPSATFFPGEVTALCEAPTVVVVEPTQPPEEKPTATEPPTVETGGVEPTPQPVAVDPVAGVEVEAVVLFDTCPEPVTVGMWTLTQDTELLWDALATASTGEYLKAGQSVKVVESNGSFAQILWACDTLFIEIK